jgi:hypothetical protein
MHAPCARARARRHRPGEPIPGGPPTGRWRDAREGKALLSSDRVADVIRRRRKPVIYVGTALALAGAGTASAVAITAQSPPTVPSAAHHSSVRLDTSPAAARAASARRPAAPAKAQHAPAHKAAARPAPAHAPAAHTSATASHPAPAHSTAATHPAEHPVAAHATSAHPAAAHAAPAHSAVAHAAPTHPAAAAAHAPAPHPAAVPAHPAAASRPAPAHQAVRVAVARPATPAARPANPPTVPAVQAHRPPHPGAHRHLTWALVSAELNQQTNPAAAAAGVVPAADQLTPAGLSGPQNTMQISPAQYANARAIVQQALAKRMGVRSAVIAVATSMQESELMNINYGTSDSLGLFQQRPSCGWGTAAQIMDPAYAANAFLTALQRYQANNPGWASQPLYQAAQGVQGSAFPLAYAQWESQAAQLTSQIATSLK